MLFRLTITVEAESQMQALPARERRVLEAAILARLQHQPTAISRAIKRLRPNPLAEYELRVGDLRVVYNVEADEVILLVIGRKAGNQLIVNGEESLAIKTIPLSHLEMNPLRTLSECADSGQAIVVELPDHRLIAIQPLEPSEDDGLIDDLLATNPAFQALVARSKASPRKPFGAPADNGIDGCNHDPGEPQ